MMTLGSKGLTLSFRFFIHILTVRNMQARNQGSLEGSEDPPIPKKPSLLKLSIAFSWR